jgi:hypothetical protein
MIENKGLTDEEIQKLIDKEIEWNKEFKDIYLPMIIKSRLFEIEMKKIREDIEKRKLHSPFDYLKGGKKWKKK